jgi:hypothetical protein
MSAAVACPRSGDAPKNETWYSTTIFYDFEIDVDPDTQYQPGAGSKAELVVRNVGTDTAPRWRLVELHDQGEGCVAVLLANGASACESATLGAVKALYR